MIPTSAGPNDQVFIDAYGGVTHAKLISQNNSSLSLAMSRAIGAIKRISKGNRMRLLIE